MVITMPFHPKKNHRVFFTNSFNGRWSLSKARLKQFSVVFYPDKANFHVLNQSSEKWALLINSLRASIRVDRSDLIAALVSRLRRLSELWTISTEFTLTWDELFSVFNVPYRTCFIANKKKSMSKRQLVVQPVHWIIKHQNEGETTNNSETLRKCKVYTSILTLLRLEFWQNRWVEHTGFVFVRKSMVTSLIFPIVAR